MHPLEWPKKEPLISRLRSERLAVIQADRQGTLPVSGMDWAQSSSSVGVMSQVLAALESNPFAPTLDIRGPYVRYLSCLDAWAPEFPSAMRVRLRDMASWDDLASDLAASDVIVRSFLTTTQAVDIVRGGDKINALPEMVTGGPRGD